MKLIVQIPCLNEEASIAQTIRDIPRQIPGIDQIELLVIDDASTDRTAELALEHGADYVVRLRANQGLARAFRAGIDECLRHGADVVVNTDGDNQYCGQDIPSLVQPILEHKADFVVGVRDISSIHHFPLRKKLLQYMGSWVVRQLSGTDVRDVTSGFRAFSRDVATRLDLVTDYTHTLETIVALGKERVAIEQVPIRTNRKQRESRLFPSIWHYVARCTSDLVRIYVRYESLKTFATLGVFAMLIGLANGLYYLVNRFTFDGRSLVALAFFSLFSTAGLLLVVLGFLGDSIACNRRMLANISRRLRDEMG